MVRLGKWKVRCISGVQKKGSFPPCNEEGNVVYISVKYNETQR
jgi:hypothetical protein